MFVASSAKRCEALAAYVIGGLTTSDCRRRPADALMQMTCVGFPTGYADFVRLYIGRKSHSEKGAFNLYEAYEGICRDGIEIRNDLRVGTYPMVLYSEESFVVDFGVVFCHTKSDLRCPRSCSQTT